MKEAEKKADEIMCKYVSLTHYCEINTKQCALIHVEGIIEVFNQEKEEMIIPLSDYDYKVFMGFWQEVKTIIENK